MLSVRIIVIALARNFAHGNDTQHVGVLRSWTSSVRFYLSRRVFQSKPSTPSHVYCDAHDRRTIPNCPDDRETRVRVANRARMKWPRRRRRRSGGACHSHGRTPFAADPTDMTCRGRHRRYAGCTRLSAARWKTSPTTDDVQWVSGAVVGPERFENQWSGSWRPSVRSRRWRGGFVRVIERRG